MGWSWAAYLATPSDVLHAVVLMWEEDRRRAEIERQQQAIRSRRPW